MSITFTSVSIVILQHFKKCNNLTKFILKGENYGRKREILQFN